ncbi:DJ-1/PfpI family protein [uncultured Tateyamaria sp.]|uniref:DJ-1/PfpI family protein n=1 Tax=uncultured Tateyamaria sp. TaxID=455651 RepID=UPI00260C8A43|nr:DJ-1/PfpI family protein [uncultured Tateyamaria sp.]
MRTLAAVLFEDFEMLDLYGPLEMFSFFRDDFEIRTVAAQTGPVKASGGPSTYAEDTFDDGRKYDMLLVPGGRGTRNVDSDETFLKWLKDQSDSAEYTTSVCTGSLLLSKAGVLEGRCATTNKLAFDWVVDQTSGVDWQRSARWVKDGSIYTSSGVSAGMDMALAVIEDCLGEKPAQDAANWAEYIRNPDPDNDPFAATGERT